VPVQRSKEAVAVIRASLVGRCARTGVITVLAVLTVAGLAAAAAAAPGTGARDETLPRPTHGNPLKIYFGGDSMAYDPGAPFAQIAAATGVMRCRVDSVISSRIVTDFKTNWPARMRQAMAAQHPKAVLFMVGANEGGWSLTVNGKYLDFWTKEWRAYYRHRVDLMMDIMFKGGAKRVYWVGMPMMGPAAYSGMNNQMIRLNNCVKKEVEVHPGARYIDSWSILCTKSGAYVDAWRYTDDVHLSTSGGKRLAAYIMRAVKKDWLPPQ
jgi:hypothetical protein